MMIRTRKKETGSIMGRDPAEKVEIEGPCDLGGNTLWCMEGQGLGTAHERYGSGGGVWKISFSFLVWMWLEYHFRIFFFFPPFWWGFDLA